MEQKKQIKISMSGFFLTIAIIAIIVMGYFIYKISNEKAEKESQIASLNNEISGLQNSSKELQGKIDSIANTINNTTGNVKNNLTKIEGTFIPQLEGPGDPPAYIFKEDGTVELAGNYSSIGTYTIKGDEINIVYTKRTGSDLNETINEKDKISIVNENTLKSGNIIYKKEIQYKNEYLKIINEIEKENPSENITGDLIYFNNDNIPDLVIGKSGYWVSLYIYENNKIYNPIDRFPYGAAGNTGYKYQEKKGTILNYNSDYAGAIITKSILILNSKNELDELTVTQKGTTDENTNIEEINKVLKEYGGYFYNKNKISEQEYNNKLKELSINADEKTFKELIGNKTISEIRKQL